jgi:hypothetical protein
MQLTNSEIWASALSFRPLRRAVQSDYMMNLSERERELSERKQNFVDGIISALKNNDMDTANRLIVESLEYIPNGMAPITSRDIGEEALRKMMTSPMRKFLNMRRALRPEMAGFQEQLEEMK